MDALNDRRERAARNQSLFREINERIDELSEAWSDEDRPYLCECLDTSCTEILKGLTHDDYRQVRHDRTEFVVLPGHERLDVEEVVDRQPRWLVVRKIGAGVRVAQQFAPPTK